MTIYIYVDGMERARFFKKFSNPLKKTGKEVVYIAGTLSSSLYLKSHGCTTIPLRFKLNKRKKTSMTILDTQKILSRSLSVASGYHSGEEACEIFENAYTFFSCLKEERRPSQVWLWSGTTTIALALQTVFKNDTALRFFELSNLGKRLFVDPQGTNANSFVCYHQEILDSCPCDEKTFDEWKTKYIQSINLPPQSKNKKHIPWERGIDLLGSWLLKYPMEDRRDKLRLLYNKLKNIFQPIDFPVLDLSSPFVFAPLQVSNDAQVKLFSKYGNFDIIDKGIEIAEEIGCKLVVKIHPAESDREQIEKICSLAQRKGFEIVGNDTGDLIRKSEHVVVNNSTVGLMALIYEKPVTVLGEAIYKSFNQNRLRSYIINYLIEGDYFGETPMSAKSINAIIEHDENWCLLHGSKQ